MSDHPDQFPLPQMFVTGNKIVDEEHRHLCELVYKLRSICTEIETRESCQGCSEERISRCESVLLDCISDLLNFMVEHFRSEENLMKDLGISQKHRERYLIHAEDHANIADHVALLTHPRTPLQTVKTVAETVAVISRWLDHHIANHDVPMLH